jgi:hypothetical protein
MLRFFRDAWKTNRTIRNEKPQARKAARPRLSLDYLEDRLTPATLIVTTLQDVVANDAQLSLREALQAANTNTSVDGSGAGDADGDIIIFNIAGNNGAGGVIDLTSSLTISDDVTIIGNDTSGVANTQITLDGPTGDRVLLINADGGVGSSTDVTLRNLKIQGGDLAGGNGGGIFIDINESVTLDSVTLQNNSALSGGAITNKQSTLTILNSTITGNTATAGVAGQGGGAIFNEQGTLTISNSTIDSNQITASADGGAILNLQGTVTINGGSISNNNADVNLVVDGRAGGAIENNAGTITLNGVTVNNNRVNVNGGAIHTTGAGSVTIIGGTLNNNYAGAQGGALWNSATGSLTAVNVTLDNNTAAGAAATDGGGALFNVSGGTVTLVNATFTNNDATGTAGTGGAINSQGGSLVVVGGTIVGNTAQGGGGGIELAAGSATLSNNVVIASNSTLAAGSDGGGVRISGAATFNMIGGTIGGTTTTGQNGNVAVDDGGAIYIAAGSVNLSGVTIGSATNVVGDGNTAADGAGIFVAGGTLNVSTSSISGNTATTGDGAGVYVDAGSVTISSSTLAYNTATLGSGGALFIDGGTVNLLTDTISDNKAAVNGGGIAAISGTVQITSNTIAFNIANSDANATGQGGGIYVNGATVNLRNSIVAKNQALNSALGQDIFGTIVSQGYNLIQNVNDATINGVTNTNITNVDPQLGPLTNNGGTTLTRALLAGSPALNAGDPNATSPDQIGTTRPTAGGVDIGAFERSSVTTQLVALGANNTLIIFSATNPGQTTTINITGLQQGESLIDLDVRPSTGVVYALSNQGRIYTVNTTTGAVTLVSNLSVSLGNSSAAQLDAIYGFYVDARGFYENSYGGGEKFLRGIVNQFGNSWYFVLPNGDLYAWNGFSLGGALIATLSSDIFKNLDGLYDASTATLSGAQATLAETLDRTKGFYEDAAGFYQGAFGSQAKWLRGDLNQFGNPWYIITPTGDLLAWNGSQSISGTVLATFDVAAYLNPELIFEASAATLAGAMATQAQTLDETLGLYEDAAGFYQGAYGSQAKWIRGANNQFGNPWYIITQQGELLAWNGSASATGTSLFQFNTDVFHTPELLFKASQQVLTGAELTLAQNLDQQLGLYEDARGFYQGSGNDVKWLRGVQNQFGNPWYFIRPNGQFVAWNGNGLGGTVLATFTANVFLKPELLFEAFKPQNNNNSTLPADVATGIDFNPTTDRLTVFTDTDLNLSVNVDTGAVTVNPTLHYTNNVNPNLVDLAFANNFANANSTTLYAIDSITDQLVTVNQQTGVVTNVGNLGVDTTESVGFDIVGMNTGYAVLRVNGTAKLYSVNLATGQVTEISGLNTLADIIGLTALQA